MKNTKLLRMSIAIAMAATAFAAVAEDVQGLGPQAPKKAETGGQAVSPGYAPGKFDNDKLKEASKPGKEQSEFLAPDFEPAMQALKTASQCFEPMSQKDRWLIHSLNKNGLLCPTMQRRGDPVRVEGDKKGNIKSEAGGSPTAWQRKRS